MKPYFQTETCVNVYGCNIHDSKGWRQPKCPLTEDWIHNAVFPYDGVLFVHKMEQNTGHTMAWMNLKSTTHSESQSEKTT